MKILVCIRCGKEWCARTDHPLRCGKCKTPYWNLPRIKPLADLSRVGKIPAAEPPHYTYFSDHVRLDLPPDRSPANMGKPHCRSCEGALRWVKGKLVCCRIGCALEGQVQEER